MRTDRVGIPDYPQIVELLDQDVNSSLVFGLSSFHLISLLDNFSIEMIP